MRILSCLVLFGAVLAAQTGTQKGPAAPPEVDAALRARVQLFYQAHVDGKFRLADQVVAEDSKDYFFEMEKQRYLSFEIARIDYSDNFTRATVTVNCDAEIVVPVFGRKGRVKGARTSTWKLADGEWWWYIVPSAGVVTPFGVMNAQQPAPGQGAAPRMPEVPKGPGIADILKSVTADKTELRLSSTKPSSGVVKVTNRMPGGIGLRLDLPPASGLEIKLDRAQLGQGESAQVTVSYTPKENGPIAPVKFGVIVEPTGQVIPVQVTYGDAAATPAPGARK